MHTPKWIRTVAKRLLRGPRTTRKKIRMASINTIDRLTGDYRASIEEKKKQLEIAMELYSTAHSANHQCLTRKFELLRARQFVPTHQYNRIEQDIASRAQLTVRYMRTMRGVVRQIRHTIKLEEWMVAELSSLKTLESPTLETRLPLLVDLFKEKLERVENFLWEEDFGSPQ